MEDSMGVQPYKQPLTPATPVGAPNPEANSLSNHSDHKGTVLLKVSFKHLHWDAWSAQLYICSPKKICNQGAEIVKRAA